MRTYTIDELHENETAAIADRLLQMNLASAMDGLFWLPIPQNMLTETQSSHTDCAPHCMALEVTDTAIHLELLVRATHVIRCECISFASPQLQSHMIAYLHSMLDELGITY